MRIKEIMQSELTPEQLKEIMTAFNEESTRGIELRGGFYLGVNIQEWSGITVVERAGAFTLYRRIP
jgi:hypothetical protein